MTPRERVRVALSHKEPDRVPIDNNGIVSSIHEVASANLLSHLGYREDVVVLDAVQRIALNSEAGGTNNQRLFHGALRPMEVDTLQRLRDLATGGGYIFSSGQNAQANMPAENLARLFAIGREFGRYPIDAAAINSRIAGLERKD